MDTIFGHIGAAFAALSLHVARLKAWYVYAVFIVIVAVSILVLPPLGFPSGITIDVENNYYVGGVANELAAAHLIHSDTLFKVLIRLSGSEGGLQAGTYYFEHPIGMLEVAQRLTSGDTHMPEAHITFPEGMTSREMARLLAERLPGFSASEFLALAEPSEGYLFPDTYHFPLGTTPAEAYERLIDTFESRTKELTPLVEASGKPLADIVTMASIVEAETNTAEGRRIVAGILWDRLSIGMALQVDAVFGYIHDTRGYTPTAKDLDSPSPYNTYEHRGLPPTAIGNPGLETLRAALEPIETDYLYYLTGTDGTMYYARTFEEHKKNKELYLK